MNYTTTAVKLTVCNSLLPDHLIWCYMTLETTPKKKKFFVAWYVKHVRIHISCTDGDFHCEVKSLVCVCVCVWRKWSYLSGTYQRQLSEQKYRGCYCVKQEFEKAVNSHIVAFGIVTPCSMVGVWESPWWTLGGNRPLQTLLTTCSITHFKTIRTKIRGWKM